MTGTESRNLQVGARIMWSDNKKDAGTVIETNWAGVTIKWNSRSEQSILHNDMTAISVV